MFELEREALTALGHEVLSYEISNETVFGNATFLKKLDTAINAPFNGDSYTDILQFLQNNKIEISHAHNWFPAISPSVYAAHCKLSIPVVQSLHNYRLGCANGTFRRGMQGCSLCLGGSRTNAVVHRCYKGSLAGSLAWKRTIDRGWKGGAFVDQVDAYVAPSREVARIHRRMGLPENRIHVIPNACPDPFSTATQLGSDTGPALFLGRLAKEKGVDTLIDAWAGLKSRLLIAGSGPEETSLRKQASSNPNIEFLGQVAPNIARQRLQEASCLIFPSRWAEPFGLSVIEAMAAAKPVIATHLGGPAEVIKHGLNGLLVRPDDPQALRRAIIKLESDSEKRRSMGREARKTYFERYRPSLHARMLETLFQNTIQARDRRLALAL